MAYDTCLVHTESLDKILQIKNLLNEHGICYKEKTKAGGGWAEFTSLLFTTGRGSYGTNSERRTDYALFVSKEDYEKADQLVKNLL